MNAGLLLVQALSPLHPGTGQGTGVIDLPIAKEKSTGLPYLPGSSLKGVLRDACKDKALQKRVFGPDTDKADEHAGSIQVSDQHLLLMPVRSLMGTFAWVTCPFILQRLVRDCQALEIKGIPLDIPSPTAKEKCIVAKEKAAIVHERSGARHQVVLEDLDLETEYKKSANQWAEWIGKKLFSNSTETNQKTPGDAGEIANQNYWKDALAARLCIVHDDVMSFLLDTATEVVARIRLGNTTKTAAEGSLWYEEMLPAESVLYGVVNVIPVKASPEEVFCTLAKLTEKPLQIGGKSTIGHGLCKLFIIGGSHCADA